MAVCVPLINLVRIICILCGSLFETCSCSRVTQDCLREANGQILRDMRATESKRYSTPEKNDPGKGKESWVFYIDLLQWQRAEGISKPKSLHIGILQTRSWYILITRTKICVIGGVVKSHLHIVVSSWVGRPRRAEIGNGEACGLTLGTSWSGS